MKTEQELQAELTKIRGQLNKIEDKRRKEANSPLLGKCFKYSNSYGGDKRWWLYLKITKAGYWLEGWSFQRPTDGRMEVKVEKCMMSILGGYVEISQSEFDRAWTAFQNAVAKVGSN